MILEHDLHLELASYPQNLIQTFGTEKVLCVHKSLLLCIGDAGPYKGVWLSCKFHRSMGVSSPHVGVGLEGLVQHSRRQRNSTFVVFSDRHGTIQSQIESSACQESFPSPGKDVVTR